MAETIWNLLNLIGIKPERLKLEWVSSAEPNKLVEDMKSYMTQIRELGPLGVAEGLAPEDLKFYLDSASGVCQNLQVRTIYGNIAKELKKMQDFSLESIKRKVEDKLLPVLKNKLYELEIKDLLKDGPKSIDFLTQKLRATPDELNPILAKLIKG